jgi:hypothetical protein
MFVVPKKDGPYTVFVAGGEVAVLETKARVVKHVGGFRALRWQLCTSRPLSLAAWLEQPDPGFWAVSPRFLVLNAMGEVLTCEDFTELEPKADDRRPGAYGRRWPGSRRTAYRNWLRFPRTQHERRQNALVVAEDGEDGARGRRRGRNLPSANWDLGRSTERSWKRHRRSQYHH